MTFLEEPFDKEKLENLRGRHSEHLVMVFDIETETYRILLATYN